MIRNSIKLENSPLASGLISVEGFEIGFRFTAIVAIRQPAQHDGTTQIGDG